jgi:hypothetical protein
MHTIIAVLTLAVALFGLVFVGPPASAKGKCIPATACGPQACYHWCDQYRGTTWHGKNAWYRMCFKKYSPSASQQ